MKTRMISPEAFEDFVRQYYKRIYISAIALTSSEEDSKDLVQEAFLGAFRSLEHFQERSSFYTWLYRIFLNHYFKYLRRKKRNPIQSLECKRGGEWVTVERGDERLSPGKIAEDREEKRLITEALESLPHEARTIVVMRYFEEMSCEQIAEILHCPLGTVKSRLFNARALLKEVIKR